MNSFALRKWLLWAENAATGFGAKAQIQLCVANAWMATPEPMPRIAPNIYYAVLANLWRKIAILAINSIQLLAVVTHNLNVLPNIGLHAMRE